jgi:class 3 adenylate cyclase/tetratricopeptide (TPR) repeat protein
MPACTNCGEDNSERARFCQACGTELPTVAPPPPDERKLISALFVDLVGSTERADGRDPEDTNSGLRLYHERAKREIERFGGTVEKFIGDAVVAIFGAPVARGDDGERAVRAGLRVLGALHELNAEHPGLDLQARAAVNTGEALVAVGAHPELGEALATGDVLNTAARLQAAAPPGHLIVGAETYRATRRAISYEPLPPVEAKGKRELLEVWLAITPSTEGAPGASTPFVGRERELNLLSSLWTRIVEERRPQIVTILGEPGIGKSRLAATFTSSVEAEGGRQLAGRCLPYEERTGYRASGDHVKRAAGILETDAPSVARDKLGRIVRSLLPSEETADVARYLSLLLGLGLDEPTDDRLPLFFAVRRLVETMALERPTVLVFEDLHWADTSQLDLLEYLVAHVREAPVMFLALARPEFTEVRTSWGSGLVAQSTIPLEPLPDDAAAALAATLVASFPDTAVDRIVDVAGGNALFIEELAVSLVEGFGHADALPGTVRTAIAARIDLLPPHQRAVLLNASVIGTTFWRAILGSMSSVPDLDDALAALEARDLVRRSPGSRVEGDVEFSFKHMLIREVSYATLPKAVRRDLHAAVARYIEGAAHDHLRDLAWLLAHHWREAGERRKAIDYLLLAAEHALEGWAKEEAIALFDDAVELASDLDPALATRIRLRRAMSLVDLSDFERGAEELDRVLPELDGREELEAVLARTRTTIWLEQMEEAFAMSDRARTLAEELGDPEMVAPAIGYQASVHFMTGDLGKALSGFEHAFDAWVPGTRPIDLAAVKELSSEVHYWAGNYGTAEEISRSAYELGGEIHHVEPLLRGGGWHGLTLAAMGRTEEAIQLLNSIVERARDLGSPRWGAAPLNYASLAFRDLFLIDEARRRNEEAIELVEKHGEWGMPRLQGEIDLLIADLMEGEPGRGAERWPGVWDAAINGKTWRPWLGGVRLALVGAQIALATDDPELAVERAHETIDRGRATLRRKYEAAGQVVLGEALLRLGRSEDAAAAIRAGVIIADQLGSPTERWKDRAALGHALYAIGDDDGAAIAYREAREILEAWSATLTQHHVAAIRQSPEVREVLDLTR